MNSLRTRQMLLNAAREFKREVETFSNTEISKKINEIKYLSSQKNIPKLTLRKEIIHLEDQLKRVLNVENKLAARKSMESKKITSLKRQVNALKNKLYAAEDKDLSRKVEKLSHLLGDYLAKCGTEEDITLSMKLLQEIQGKIERPEKKPKAEEKPSAKTLNAVDFAMVNKAAAEVREEDVNAMLIQKAESMQVRLNSLKHEISIHKELETKSPQQIKDIEAKVEIIEQKLKEFCAAHPEIIEAGILEKTIGTVKHKMLFDPVKPVDEFLSIEKSLPLPPPPRIDQKIE